MKILPFLSICFLFTTLMISSCSEEEPLPFVDPDPLTCTDGECTTTFQTGKRIKTEGKNEDLTYEITDGDKLVFHYTFQNDDDPMIADDEFFDELLFEIDPEEGDFLYQNDALEDINAIYNFSCFCAGVHPYLITDGGIKGQKLNDDEWRIAFDVSIPIENDTIRRAFSATFTQ